MERDAEANASTGNVTVDDSRKNVRLLLQQAEEMASRTLVPPRESPKTAIERIRHEIDDVKAVKEELARHERRRGYTTALHEQLGEAEAAVADLDSNLSDIVGSIAERHIEREEMESRAQFALEELQHCREAIPGIEEALQGLQRRRNEMEEQLTAARGEAQRKRQLVDEAEENLRLVISAGLSPGDSASGAVGAAGAVDAGISPGKYAEMWSQEGSILDDSETDTDDDEGKMDSDDENPKRSGGAGGGGGRRTRQKQQEQAIVAARIAARKQRTAYLWDVAFRAVRLGLVAHPENFSFMGGGTMGHFRRNRSPVSSSLGCSPAPQHVELAADMSRESGGGISNSLAVHTIAELQGQVKRLTNQIATRKKKFKSTELRLEAMRDRYDHLRIELVALRAAVAQLDGDTVEDLVAEIRFYKKERVELYSKLYNHRKFVLPPVKRIYTDDAGNLIEQDTTALERLKKRIGDQVEKSMASPEGRGFQQRVIDRQERTILDLREQQERAHQFMRNMEQKLQAAESVALSAFDSFVNGRASRDEELQRVMNEAVKMQERLLTKAQDERTRLQDEIREKNSKIEDLLGHINVLNDKMDEVKGQVEHADSERLRMKDELHVAHRQLQIATAPISPEDLSDVDELISSMKANPPSQMLQSEVDSSIHRLAAAAQRPATQLCEYIFTNHTEVLLSLVINVRSLLKDHVRKTAGSGTLNMVVTGKLRELLGVVKRCGRRVAGCCSEVAHEVESLHGQKDQKSVYVQTLAHIRGFHQSGGGGSGGRPLSPASATHNNSSDAGDSLSDTAFRCVNKVSQTEMTIKPSMNMADAATQAFVLVRDVAVEALGATANHGRGSGVAGSSDETLRRMEETLKGQMAVAREQLQQAQARSAAAAAEMRAQLDRRAEAESLLMAAHDALSQAAELHADAATVMKAAAAAADADADAGGASAASCSTLSQAAVGGPHEEEGDGGEVEEEIPVASSDCGAASTDGAQRSVHAGVRHSSCQTDLSLTALRNLLAEGEAAALQFSGWDDGSHASATDFGSHSHSRRVSLPSDASVHDVVLDPDVAGSKGRFAAPGSAGARGEAAIVGAGRGEREREGSASAGRSTKPGSSGRAGSSRQRPTGRLGSASLAAGGADSHPSSTSVTPRSAGVPVRAEGRGGARLSSVGNDEDTEQEQDVETTTEAAAAAAASASGVSGKCASGHGSSVGQRPQIRGSSTTRNNSGSGSGSGRRSSAMALPKASGPSSSGSCGRRSSGGSGVTTVSVATNTDDATEPSMCERAVLLGREGLALPAGREGQEPAVQRTECLDAAVSATVEVADSTVSPLAEADRHEAVTTTSFVVAAPPQVDVRDASASPLDIPQFESVSLGTSQSLLLLRPPGAAETADAGTLVDQLLTGPAMQCASTDPASPVKRVTRHTSAPPWTASGETQQVGAVLAGHGPTLLLPRRSVGVQVFVPQTFNDFTAQQQRHDSWLAFNSDMTSVEEAPSQPPLPQPGVPLMSIAEVQSTSGSGVAASKRCAAESHAAVHRTNSVRSTATSNSSSRGDLSRRGSRRESAALATGSVARRQEQQQPQQQPLRQKRQQSNSSSGTNIVGGSKQKGIRSSSQRIAKEERDNGEGDEREGSVAGRQEAGSMYREPSGSAPARAVGSVDVHGPNRSPITSSPLRATAVESHAGTPRELTDARAAAAGVSGIGALVQSKHSFGRGVNFDMTWHGGDDGDDEAFAALHSELAQQAGERAALTESEFRVKEAMMQRRLDEQGAELALVREEAGRLEATRARQQERDEMAEELSIARASVAALEEQLDEVRRINEEVLAKAGGTDGMQWQLGPRAILAKETRQQQLDGAMRRIREVQRENESLRAELGIERAKLRELAATLREHDERQELLRITKDKDRLEIAMQSTKLKGELQQTHEHVKRLRLELSEVREELAAKENEVSHAKGSGERKLQNLQGIVASLTRDKAVLKEELDRLQTSAKYSQVHSAQDQVARIRDDTRNELARVGKDLASERRKVQEMMQKKGEIERQHQRTLEQRRSEEKRAAELERAEAEGTAALTGKERFAQARVIRVHGLVMECLATIKTALRLPTVLSEPPEVMVAKQFFDDESYSGYDAERVKKVNQLVLEVAASDCVMLRRFTQGAREWHGKAQQRSRRSPKRTGFSSDNATSSSDGGSASEGNDDDAEGDGDAETRGELKRRHRRRRTTVFDEVLGTRKWNDPLQVREAHLRGPASRHASIAPFSPEPADGAEGRHSVPDDRRWVARCSLPDGSDGASPGHPSADDVPATPSGQCREQHHQQLMMITHRLHRPAKSAEDVAAAMRKHREEVAPTPFSDFLKVRGSRNATAAAGGGGVAPRVSTPQSSGERAQSIMEALRQLPDRPATTIPAGRGPQPEGLSMVLRSPERAARVVTDGLPKRVGSSPHPLAGRQRLLLFERSERLRAAAGGGTLPRISPSRRIRSPERK